MKKMLATSILAVLSIIVCCFCLFYVVAVSDETKNFVNQIESDVLNTDYKSAREKVKNLDEFLQSNHTMLSTIVHHSILEEIEESVALLKTSLQYISEEEQTEFWLESARSLSRIKNLRDVEIPSVANIF